MDPKRTELHLADWKDGETPYNLVTPNGAFNLCISIVGGVGFTNEQARSIMAEVKMQLNAYPAHREAVKALVEALDLARVQLGYALVCAPVNANTSGLRSALVGAEKALKLASALGVGESTLKENGE